MKRFGKLLETLASVKFTLVCLGLMMVLVVLGTLAQVDIGTFSAQKKYFYSFWVWTGETAGSGVPIFPGGLAVGTLWMINLLASFITRFELSKKDVGLWLTHGGLILLLLGQFLTQLLSVESQMPVEVGQTSNYSESARNTELAVTMTSKSGYDEVLSIPYHRFNRPGIIETPRLPFQIIIRRFFANAQVAMAKGTPTMATQGVGTQVNVEEAPPVSSDDEANQPAVYAEIFARGKSMGTWLLTPLLGAPQSVNVDGKDYVLSLRSIRRYLPFTLTLKEFHHDIYPGTDIPKNFSSLVHLNDPQKNESRDVLIYMNHPLRYRGLTFYQASYGKNDTLSIFQVVRNPAWVTPYVSCTIILLGLALQFLSHLFVFLRNRS